MQKTSEEGFRCRFLSQTVSTEERHVVQKPDHSELANKPIGDPPVNPGQRPDDRDQGSLGELQFRLVRSDQMGEAEPDGLPTTH